MNEILKEVILFFLKRKLINLLLFIKSCAISVSDDWANWNKFGENINFAKPLFID